MKSSFYIFTVFLFVSLIIYPLYIFGQRKWYLNNFTNIKQEAFLFDGVNDFITVPHNSAFNVQTFTVECLVKFNNIETSGKINGTGGYNQFLICKGKDYASGTYRLFQQRKNNDYLLRFEVGEYWKYKEAISVTLPLVSDKWYHVAGTYDGDVLKVYLDGVLVGEKQIGSYTINTQDALVFGYHDVSGWNYNFSGEIDEVRIWSVARTEAEIQNTMYREIDSGSGLVAVWHFNGMDDQIVIDSVNGKNGYLGSTMNEDSNDPLWTANNIPVPSATIVVDAPAYVQPGESFWVDINAQDVRNLFGVSFVLNYSQGTYVDVVTTKAGDFLGNDIVFYPEVNEETGTVSVGMSRKAGQGEVEGSGVLARIQFTSNLETPLGTVTEFFLSELTANDEDGNPLVLTTVGYITTITQTVTVWPGDTNNDGTVDQSDVLPLGLYWASTGPAREGGSYQWTAQLCQTWSPETATYADATGDGKVNQADVLPIGLNWDKTQVIPKITVYNNGNTADKTVAVMAITKPVPFIELPVNAGDEFWVEIQVSDVSSLFGMSFVLTYDNKDAIEPLTCEQETFIGDDVIIFSQVDNSTDEVAVGISRKSGQGGVDGTGTVIRIKFRMSQDFDGNSGINLSLSDVAANDPSGENINLTIEDGQIGTVVDSDELTRLPREFSLSQNYPNPFNPSTTISFSIPEQSFIKLSVYDLTGQIIATLIDKSMSAGSHSVIFDGSDLGSGVYLYRLKSGRFSKTDKMLLMK